VGAVDHQSTDFAQHARRSTIRLTVLMPSPCSTTNSSLSPSRVKKFYHQDFDPLSKMSYYDLMDRSAKYLLVEYFFFTYFLD